MKKCFYLVIMMLVSISANADDYFKHGGIRYKIESFVDQELRVTYPEEEDYTTTHLVIPATIKTKQGQVWTVTAIGSYAFERSTGSGVYGYKNLISVSIPKTVKFIHKDAFKQSDVKELKVESKDIPRDYVENITSLYIGAAAGKGVNDSFFNKTFKKLEKITVAPTHTSYSVIDGVLYNKDKTKLLYFPKGKKILKMPLTVKECIPSFEKNKDLEEAFISCTPKSYQYSECSSLKKVSFSNNVTEIGYGSFYKCNSLINIQFSNSIKKLGAYAFCGCTSLNSVVLPNSISEIDLSAFSNCASLTDVVLPSNIIKTDQIFTECSSLERISIPESVKSMKHTFAKCTKLKSVNIPVGIVRLHSTFFDCSSLESISLPSKLEEIGEGTFNGCKNLSSIKIPESVKIIDEKAFYECSKLTEIDIPNSVKSIGYGAFLKCESLKNVTLGSSLDSIGNSAFLGCNIEQIVLPDCIRYIDMSAFKKTKLKEVKIPAGIKKLGAKSFDVNGIKVFCYATNPPTRNEEYEKASIIGPYDRQKSSGGEVHIPRGTKSAYLNIDYWKGIGNLLIDDL